MRTVESSTALGMVLAILFDYLGNVFLLFLGTLVGIGCDVFDTGHRLRDLRPGLLTIDHDFWCEDNHVVLDRRFQEIPNA